MDIFIRKISELKFADYNPRTISTTQFEQLKRSLKEFGFVDPIVVNQHPSRLDTIVGGHMRVRASQALGMDEVPCVYVNLPIDREKILNIRLNHDGGEFDYEALSTHYEIETLLDVGFSKLELGMDDEPLPPKEKDGNKNREHTCPNCGHTFTESKDA